MKTLPSGWQVTRYPGWDEQFWAAIRDFLIIHNPLPIASSALEDEFRSTATTDKNIQALKAGTVWRLDHMVLKKYNPDPFPVGLLRTPPAYRAARRALWIKPIPTTDPLLVISHRWHGALQVSRYVSGVSFDHLWEKDKEALDAFPAFMAAMHQRQIFHGDLHGSNLIWTQGQWAIIDLDSLRMGLHRLNRWRNARRQWAYLHFRHHFSPRMKDLFDRYHQLMNHGRSPDHDWSQVVSLAHEFARRRAQRDREKQQGG